MTDMSAFSRSIYEQKYAHTTKDGKEDWADTAKRVVRNVMKSVDAPAELVEELEGKTMPPRPIPPLANGDRQFALAWLKKEGTS